jgi:hypothetical protein
LKCSKILFDNILFSVDFFQGKIFPRREMMEKYPTSVFLGPFEAEFFGASRSSFPVLFRVLCQKRLKINPFYNRKEEWLRYKDMQRPTKIETARIA